MVSGNMTPHIAITSAMHSIAEIIQIMTLPSTGADYTAMRELPNPIFSASG